MQSEAIMSSLSHSPILSTPIVRVPVLGHLVEIVRRLAREIRIRSDLRQLGEFDDAALSDIGISRGEIEGAVRGGRSRRN